VNLFEISGLKMTSSDSMHKNTIEKLRGSDNYQTWAFAVKSLLELNDLEKCIVPGSTAGSVAETDASKLKKAKAKIILSIESTLYVHIQNCTTAVEIWLKLKTMYEDTGLSRRIGLLRTLINT
jgi:gag-polypeptide of LTR copia-type